MHISAVLAAEGVRGRVINQKGEPVGYATVVAMVGDWQHAGAITDDKGEFLLRLADGEYRLVVEFVGYKSYERAIKVEQGSCSVDDVVLQEAATDIDEVVVKATMIRREADRYVVDVANSDAAIGKDGVDLFASRPVCGSKMMGCRLMERVARRSISTSVSCVCRVRSLSVIFAI